MAATTSRSSKHRAPDLSSGWRRHQVRLRKSLRRVRCSCLMVLSPLMSIFSHVMELPQSRRPKSIRFVYASKTAGSPILASEILFLQRLMKLVNKAPDGTAKLDLYLTAASEDDVSCAEGLPSHVKCRRIGPADLDKALGDVSHRHSTVCYVCGPPRMTDIFVDFLSSRTGMERGRVLCEKWW